MYGKITPSSISLVIDVGNLNLNATYWQGAELITDKSITADLGCAHLIQSLTQELTAIGIRADENIIANILKSEDRSHPEGLTIPDELSLKVKETIKKTIHKFAEEIKWHCDSRKWPLDLINVIAIGGTSKLIEEELKDVFKNNIIVLKNPEYLNVLGYLRIMCAQDPKVAKEIPIDAEPSKEVKEKKAG